jgi:hypothetical protein
MGRSIPTSFRHVLLSYSAHVRIEWQLRDTSPLPEVFRQIFAGECRWDLSELPALEDTYQAWLRAFPLTDDKYDGPWHNKFPVLEVGNGDMLAIDLSVTDPQPVVYLSHEGDDSLHGFWLGRDYEDYIDRLIQLGCVGSEDWQLLPFVSGPRSSLLPDGENGQQWRKWFGLAFPENDAQSSEC